MLTHLTHKHNFKLEKGFQKTNSCVYKEPSIHSRMSFPSQTIPDCTRYMIGVFCYNYKSQMDILALH